MLVFTHLSKYLKQTKLALKDSVQWMQIYNINKLSCMQYLNDIPIGIYKKYNWCENTNLINLYRNNTVCRLSIAELSIYSAHKIIENPSTNGNIDLIIGIKNNQIQQISILDKDRYKTYTMKDNNITIYTINTYIDSLNYTYTARVYNYRSHHQIIKVKRADNKIVFKSILMNNYYIIRQNYNKKYGYRIICFDKEIESFIIGNIMCDNYKIYSRINKNTNPIIHSSLKMMYNIKNELYSYYGIDYI